MFFMDIANLLFEPLRGFILRTTVMPWSDLSIHTTVFLLGRILCPLGHGYEFDESCGYLFSSIRAGFGQCCRVFTLKEPTVSK